MTSPVWTLAKRNGLVFVQQLYYQHQTIDVAIVGEITVDKMFKISSETQGCVFCVGGRSAAFGRLYSWSCGNTGRRVTQHRESYVLSGMGRELVREKRRGWHRTEDAESIYKREFYLSGIYQCQVLWSLEVFWDIQNSKV
jgi:hypothetical protein